MYEDLNNTKIGFLSEERSELKSKVSKLEETIKIKESSYEFVNNEYRSFKISTNEQISHIKIQYKIKSDDYDRLNGLYLEMNEHLKAIKNENETFKEKYDILRKEIIAREVQYKEELCNLKSENVILKESKSHYDKMEDELDRIIVDSSLNDA